ncbi:GNAT family N-acetyltransferase [Kribbella sp. NPDC026611]|uniref:GNAT family N-acetyltransferase n=1 Tax=Kribbella sp. NPDC026611 TaxID=3154911 RepID=UPI0033F40CFD
MVLEAFSDPDIQHWHVRRIDTLREAEDWLTQWPTHWATEQATSWAITQSPPHPPPHPPTTAQHPTAATISHRPAPANAPSTASDLTAGQTGPPATDLTAKQARLLRTDLASLGRIGPLGTDPTAAHAGPLGTDPTAAQAGPLGTDLTAAQAGPLGTDLTAKQARSLETDLAVRQTDSLGADLAVGQIGLRAIDLADGTVSLSYWLLPAARGRGLATSAVAALETWCFALGFQRLVIQHSTLNHASCRLATSCGYPLEGTLQNAWLQTDGRHNVHLHAKTTQT